MINDQPFFLRYEQRCRGTIGLLYHLYPLLKFNCLWSPLRNETRFAVSRFLASSSSMSAIHLSIPRRRESIPRTDWTDELGNVRIYCHGSLLTAVMRASRMQVSVYRAGHYTRFASINWCPPVMSSANEIMRPLVPSRNYNCEGKGKFKVITARGNIERTPFYSM